MFCACKLKDNLSLQKVRKERLKTCENVNLFGKLFEFTFNLISISSESEFKFYF